MTPASRALILILLLACVPSLKSVTVAPINYSALIAEARRAWNADRREIADMLRRLAAASDKAARLEENLNRDRKALAQLQADKAQALADLRSGAFCTGCGRTRSDLLAHGESFPHPGQQSRPATPAELEAAEKDFNNRMDLLRRKIARLEPEFKSAQAEIMDAHHRLMVRLPAFHKHLAQEQETRLGKWLEEKTAAETDIKALHEALAAPTEPSKDGDAGQTRAARERLAQQLIQRVASAKSAEDRARQEERFFRKDVLANLDSLAAIARPIPDRYGVNGPFIATNIRNPPRPIGYTVVAVYVGGRSATVSDLQQLLNGPAKSNPAPQTDAAKSPAPGEKSVRDLLDGK